MKLSRLSDPLFLTGLVLALLLMILDRFGLLPFGAGVDMGAPAGLLLAWGIGHCDTLDGPVVNLARKALETGNVNQVLPWVPASDEVEIKTAFSHVLAVRKNFAVDDVKAGRRFVESYVPYVHYVERLWQAITGEDHGHHPEVSAHQHHPH